MLKAAANKYLCARINNAVVLSLSYTYPCLAALACLEILSSFTMIFELKDVLLETATSEKNSFIF